MYELEELDNTHAIVMSSLLAGSQLDGLGKFEESTQGVDGPVSWRLTLDQDLIDTLKGSFPNWFQNSPETSSSSSPSSITTLAAETQLADSDVCNGLITVQLATSDISYQDSILHESFDSMAEGDRLGNPSASTGPSLLGTDGSNTTMTNCYDSRHSPPKAIVDSSPLQPAMDKNKESLKVKLMVRRPITQLVEQGIIPPLKTSPAIHEQCKQLERAKTGDLLKAKIQQRPDRQELERRHILEHEESHVDPSLAEKQRMLKKARLADQLNSQISHRPGPLELIKKNILHTEQPIERIVKEGLVSFKATSEGLLNRPQQPNSYITFEDDSQSSESDTRTSPARSDVIEAAAASAGIVTVALTIPTSGGTILQTKFHPTLIPTAATTAYVPPPPPLPNITSTNKSSEQIQVKQETTSNLFAELCQSVAGTSPSHSFLPLAASPASLGSSTSTLSPLSSVASPPQSTTPRPTPSPLQHIHQSQRSDAPGKDKNRKKSKSKPVSKARTIKFHEYKGPPNAQKNSSLEPSTKESSYQLMLEQQNCLLRFLENLHKNRTILQVPPKNTNNTTDANMQNQVSNSTPMPSPALSVASSIPSSPAPSHTDSVTTTTPTIVACDVVKLEKMKVSDLKGHLKKRNLPVSGTKPQLIERLKPYLPLETLESAAATEVMSTETCDTDIVNSPRHSMSPESEHENMDVQQVDSPAPSVSSITNDDIVREQQRRIDELQRQLELSKQELLQIKQNQAMVVEPAAPPPPPINQKLVVKQQLEAKIQKQLAKQQAQLALKNKQAALNKPKEEPKLEQIQMQQIQIQTHQPVQPQHINQIPIMWNGDTATVLLLGVQDNKKFIGGHQRTASLPSILLPIPTTTTQQTLHTVDTKPIINQVITAHETIPHLQQTVEIKPPPPLYEEATKQLNASNALKQKSNQGKKHVKSDNLTDILNILVKNGDISPSALDPTTPSTPGSVIMSQEILFDNNITVPQLVQAQAHLSTQHAQPQLQQIQLQSPPQPQQVQLQIQPQPQSQTQQSPDAAQKAEVTVFDASLFLNTPQTPIQSMDMTSPLQPDCHIDNDNVASALDTFLQEHSEDPPANGDIGSYDDFDLLELMSQQLDMDISDETSCHNYTPMETNSSTVANSTSYQKSCLNSKREMNPCLQPSINELIQQQEQQQNGNNSSSNISSSNENDPTMNCNGLLNGFDSSSFDLGNSNNNYSTTPMDVCDDFETHLNNFSFSSLSPDSNINTPPHPFSSALATSTSNGPGSHNSLDFNGSSNSNGHLMNGSCDNDAFGGGSLNQDNLPELFNIDDYKMGWSVDFAV